MKMKKHSIRPHKYKQTAITLDRVPDRASGVHETNEGVRDPLCQKTNGGNRHGPSPVMSRKLTGTTMTSVLLEYLVKERGFYI